MKLSVKRTRPGRSPRGLDEIAVEEPLEIRLRWIDSGQEREERVGTTMRTPGDDFELARGFLIAEGILGVSDSPAGISHCTDGKAEEPLNVVTVTLREGSAPDLEHLETLGHGTSACGICGRTRLEDVLRKIPEIVESAAVDPQWLATLPGLLRDSQKLFESTGGVHAAGAWPSGGELIALREDVGRHNALDKLV